MYSGTLGMKHRPDLLLVLAKSLETRGDAKLVVIAGGAGAEWLAARKHEVMRETMELLPFQPYERLPEVMGSADVLITLLDSEAGAFAVPSKTLAYLCAGRALLIAAPPANEAARVVERANAGIVVSPDNPAEITGAADRLLADRGLCVQYGSNGRAYAERTFAIEDIASRFLGILAGSASAGSEAIVEPAPAKAVNRHIGAL
jgi:colanic acid biosynthesis glycosyl transferase WcaI